MEDSISRPMFVLLRCFAEMVDDESRNRSTIAELLVELYKLQPKMGYFLLYYLRARYINLNFLYKTINLKLIY